MVGCEGGWSALLTALSDVSLSSSRELRQVLFLSFPTAHTSHNVLKGGLRTLFKMLKMYPERWRSEPDLVLAPRLSKVLNTLTRKPNWHLSVTLAVEG